MTVRGFWTGDDPTLREIDLTLNVLVGHSWSSCQGGIGDARLRLVAAIGASFREKGRVPSVEGIAEMAGRLECPPRGSLKFIDWAMYGDEPEVVA